MISEDLSTIFTDSLDCLRWKAKETTSDHGGSFLSSVRMMFANYFRFDDIRHAKIKL